MNRLAQLPALLLFLLGLFSFLRGVFHFVWFDSGAGVIAGMNLSYPNGADVIFLLGAAGILQMALGTFYMFFALRAQQFIGFALSVEVVRSILLVVMQYSFKMPTNPVPGRYAHIVVFLVATIATLIYFANRPNRHSPENQT